MSEPDLLRIVYISQEAKRFTPLDLQELLVTARNHNGSKDITGLLLYKHGNFMQVIEGPATEVESLFDRILADPRHQRIFEVARDPIDTRDFSDWSMAFRDLETQPLPELQGYNWFLSKAWDEADLTNYSGKIRSFLTVFARATSTP